MTAADFTPEQRESVRDLVAMYGRHQIRLVIRDLMSLYGWTEGYARQAIADKSKGKAADFTPERIAELRDALCTVSDIGKDEEWTAMLDAIEELQAALLATIKITVVEPKTEADFTPEKLAEIAADLMGPRH